MEKKFPDSLRKCLLAALQLSPSLPLSCNLAVFPAAANQPCLLLLLKLLENFPTFTPLPKGAEGTEGATPSPPLHSLPHCYQWYIPPTFSSSSSVSVRLLCTPLPHSRVHPQNPVPISLPPPAPLTASGYCCSVNGAWSLGGHKGAEGREAGGTETHRIVGCWKTSVAPQS